MAPGLSRWSVRGTAFVLASVASACGHDARPVRPLPSAEPPVVPVAVTMGPAARGEVDVAILSRAGGYYPGVVEPNPPGDLVKPCLEGPSAVHPLVAGWLVYSLVFPYDAPTTLALVDKSASVPEALAACVTRALSQLRKSEPGLELNSSLIAYVSLR